MRTDSEQPWTPGPWTRDWESTYNGVVASWWIRSTHLMQLADAEEIERDHVCGDFAYRADADLCALAPEMAELILEVAKPQEHVVGDRVVYIEAPIAVVELAKRLRAISGEAER